MSLVKGSDVMYIKRISSNTFRVWIDLPNDGTRNRPSKVFHATSKKDLTYQIEKWRDSISVIPSDCKTVRDRFKFCVNSKTDIRHIEKTEGIRFNY